MRRGGSRSPGKSSRIRFSNKTSPRLEIQAAQICPLLCHTDCLYLHRKSSNNVHFYWSSLQLSLVQSSLNYIGLHSLFSFWCSVLFAGGGATHDPEHDDKLRTHLKPVRAPRARSRDTEGQVVRSLLTVVQCLPAPSRTFPIFVTEEGVILTKLR